MNNSRKMQESPNLDLMKHNQILATTARHKIELAQKFLGIFELFYKGNKNQERHRTMKSILWNTLETKTTTNTS